MITFTLYAMTKTNIYFTIYTFKKAYNTLTAINLPKSKTTATLYKRVYVVVFLDRNTLLSDRKFLYAK